MAQSKGSKKEVKGYDVEVVADKFFISYDKEMSLVDSGLGQDQIRFLLGKTPPDHIYKRPAKGGGEWEYVTGTYVQKVLNFVFGWNWDFDVVEQWEYPRLNDSPKYVVVKGKLTVRVIKNKQLREVSKTQFGRADVKYKTKYVNNKKVVSDEPLDIGNDYKAASTDALKKCASMLGIASDVYGGNEFKDVKIEVSMDDEQMQKNIEKKRKEYHNNKNNKSNEKGKVA